ncbi:MAG: NACHT domain-containing protein [Planktothrix agardhii LY1]|uniref:NACHT C-terminal alpha/beta 1 domain-containing protein n=1 Tax=Planktothrix agardhii TaxID=1160 RepID=UPI0024317BEA|nr:NACHT domain-containing protein [Planktothrix agardhii]MCP9293523.1 NACHT domain-containing protein [Planktothrix agardhii LY1]
MASNANQSEEKFSEAYLDWEIERLYADLANSLKKTLSPNAKTYLRGILCGYSPKEIAEKLDLRAKDTSIQVRQILTAEVYQAVKNQLGINKIKNYSEIPKLLEQEYRKPVKQSETIDIDWYKVCHTILARQQEDQQIRRKATEMGFEVKVYVPLGLLERKQQQRRSGIINTEQIHQLDQEVITQIYKHQEFLDDIIGQQPTDQDQHIAIIGEPGAGKTTLLDRIATYIKDKNQDLFICISLANLQGRSIKTYILNEWLPKAIAVSYPELDPESLEKTFQHRLNQGGVWLLLDGADEGKISLADIQTELSNFVKIRVVLTCRTNVWDIYVNNPLMGFKTYKTQDFKPEQIDEFIQKWFVQAKDEPKGKKLQEELKEPQRDRIRQLVANPLRLALLCQIFYKVKNPNLPETKAGLYEQFVRYFYEWKPAIVGIDWGTQPQLQDELHQGLGKLAIAGLDSDYRYRLPLSLIKTEMDDKLFKLAWDLGWLTLVEREEKTDEEVYAFYHPTFQEYFAALAVDDWDFFLPSDHVDTPVTGKPYRIFEPHWKEVFLLYMGLPSYRVENQSKDNLINKILNFDDGCGEKFYQYRSYILAAMGLSEWNFFSGHSKVVKQLIEYYCNSEKYSDLINLEQKEEIKLILKQLNQNLVVQEIIEFEKRSNFEDSNINRLLNDISRNNQKTIDTIIDNINNIIKNPDINKWYMILDDSLITLEQIAFGNQTAINTLIFLVINTIEIMLEIDSYLLAKIKNNEIDSNHNLDKIKRIIKSDIIRPALRTLSTIAIGNLLSIEFLNTLIEWEFTEDPEILSVLATSLYQIYPSSNKPIKIIEKLLLKPDQEVIVIIYDILKILEKIANPEAVTLLIKAYKTESNIQHKQVILESLGNIDCETVLVTKFLKEVLLTDNEDSWISIQAAKSLAKLEPGSPDAIDALTTIISTSQDEYLLLNTSVTLLEISEKTISTVKPVIERLCKEGSNSSVCFESTKKLIEIDNKNPIAIQTLIEFIYCRFHVSEYFNTKARKILSELCFQENKNAIESIWQFIENNINLRLETDRDILGSDIETFLSCFEILIKSEQEKKKNKKMIEEKMINIILIHLPLMNNPDHKPFFGFITPRLFDASKILMEIEKNHDYAVKNFIEIIDWMSKNLLPWGGNSNYLIKLVDLCGDNLPVIKKIIDLTFYQTDFWSRDGAIQGLKTLSDSVILIEVVKYCKQYLNGDNNPDQNKDLNTIIWHCAQHMSYPEFHQAWHEPNQETIKQLETQYNDIGKLFNQLQPTAQVYPILIDGKYSLENLTDESAIAQELCNQIYYTILPDDDIPTVKNAPELKRLFPKFKRQLNISTLVFIIYNIEPYPELINVCRQLLGKFHIAFITDQQIEPDLRGFPMQNNLVNILQNWLTEISYKETL